MAYGREAIYPFLTSTAVEATAADLLTWKPEHPILVHDLEVVVTTLVATDTTATVVSIDRTQSGGSRTEMGTITIPDATAANTSISIKENDSSFVPFWVDEGESLFVEHKTAGADAGTETGDYYFNIYYETVPDGQF